MIIEDKIELLDDILDHWKIQIGSDFHAYKNHVYRVVNFCFALDKLSEADKTKIIIAGCFHDLGIWVNDTFNYLTPSIDLATQYLHEHARDDWIDEIALMIDMHHKISRFRDKQFPLVEIFRKADWIDVTKGIRSFGLAKEDIQTILAKFRNAGFHKRLIQLTRAEFKRHPLNPMPMMKL